MIKTFVHIYETIRSDAWVAITIKIISLPLLPSLYDFAANHTPYDLPTLSLSEKIIYGALLLFIYVAFYFANHHRKLLEPKIELLFESDNEFMEEINATDQTIRKSYRLGVKNLSASAIKQVKINLVSIQKDTEDEKFLGGNLKHHPRGQEERISLNARDTDYFWFIEYVKASSDDGSTLDTRSNLPNREYSYFRLNGYGANYYRYGKYCIKVRVSGENTSPIEASFKVDMTENSNLKVEKISNKPK